MKYTDDVFKKAYLSQLGLIKEDVDAEVASVETEDKPTKQITFITTDDKLVDALNSGFEEVVIFTNAKDEATGEDTVVEVKFGKDSFGNFEITDVVETDPDEADADSAEIEECGDVVEEDDEDVEVVEEDDEDAEVVEEDDEDAEVVEEDEDEDDKDTADDEKDDDKDDKEDDKDVATECKSKHKINSPY